MCFLLCFNKCTLYAQGQTASMSAKLCGLNFHRLGLPLIFICAYPRPQRVRFTDCGAKVFPVLGLATSTEVLQPLQCLGLSHVPIHCYMLKGCGTLTTSIVFALYCSVSANRATFVTLLQFCHHCNKIRNKRNFSLSKPLSALLILH